MERALWLCVILAAVSGGCASDAETGSAASTAAVSRIALPSQLRLDTGNRNSAKLQPLIEPAAASGAVVMYSSDKPAVASVDDAGRVAAKSAGTAIITATTADGHSASCKVYVFGLWVDEDFEDGSTSSWELRPPSGADGTFSVVSDGSQVLKYDANMTGGVLGTIAPAAWANVPRDYYVEARIKPLTNSTTGNKQLYLIARYQDDDNWYGAGLNVQSSTASTQVELVKMADGKLTRPVQIKRPIAQDSTWYTVRFELQGSMLSVYLDGVLIKSYSDEQWASGAIGLYTANKSFEIDDIRVGDPRDRPVQLALELDAWATEAKGPAKQVHVSAQRPSYEDGSYTEDTFSASSSDPAVAALAIEHDSVSITPLTAGQATATFVSGTDPTLTRTLTVTVEPEFVQSPLTYNLTGKTLPAAGYTAAYGDTSLSLTFDGPPVLGDHGSVRIFRASDDAQVDVIRLKNETDVIGPKGPDGQAPRRYVYTDSRIRVVDSNLVISPHNAVLAPNTAYYVAIADGLVSGQLGGAAFQGIGKAAGWTFTTRAELAPSKTTLTVAATGETADFRTVQGALNFVMDKLSADTPATITIANGTYDELLFVRGHNQLTLVGESRDGVVIQARNLEALNSGSGGSQDATSSAGSPGGGRALFLVENCDLLTLQSLTFVNTTRRANGVASQAETVYFNADPGRLIAKDAAFISEQDTLQLKGYAWFYKSLIAGNVDFIWGANHVALFEESEIRSIADSSNADRAFVVQARTVASADKGFVFLRSAFTHGNDVPSGPDAETYFARSSGNSSAWDNVAIVDCEVGDHIDPLGWAYDVGGQPPSNPAVSSAAGGWREYGSHGPGGDMSQRKHGYTLGAEEAQGLSTRAQVFAAWSGNTGWNPAP